MRILITGATGFLGQHLVRDLSQCKHEITALLRAGSRCANLKSSGNVAIAHYTTLSAVRGIVSAIDPDIVIHAACSYGRSGEEFCEVITSNYLFGYEVASGAAQSGALFINMDTPLPPTVSAYALTKRQFRDALKLRFPQDFRLIQVVLHTMYGPGDDPTKFTTHVVRELLCEAPSICMTPGEQIRDFIYVDDVVSALRTLIAAADSFQSAKVFELGTGNGIRLLDYVQMAKDETGATTELLTTMHYRQDECGSMVADISGLKALGWLPRIPPREGMRRMVQGDRNRWTRQ
jgi:nucleoside-diphosphate-sugar epimerase